MLTQTFIERAVMCSNANANTFTERAVICTHVYANTFTERAVMCSHAYVSTFIERALVRSKVYVNTCSAFSHLKATSAVVGTLHIMKMRGFVLFRVAECLVQCFCLSCGKNRASYVKIW